MVRGHDEVTDCDGCAGDHSAHRRDPGEAGAVRQQAPDVFRGVRGLCRVVAQQRELVGTVEQRQYAVGDDAGGGVEAGDEQASGDFRQLQLGERVVSSLGRGSEGSHAVAPG